MDDGERWVDRPYTSLEGMRVWRIINLRDGHLWTGTHCGKSDNVARRMGEVIVVWDSLQSLQRPTSQRCSRPHVLRITNTTQR